MIKYSCVITVSREREWPIVKLHSEPITNPLLDRLLLKNVVAIFTIISVRFIPCNYLYFLYLCSYGPHIISCQYLLCQSVARVTDYGWTMDLWFTDEIQVWHYWPLHGIFSVLCFLLTFATFSSIYRLYYSISIIPTDYTISIKRSLYEVKFWKLVLRER